MRSFINHFCIASLLLLMPSSICLAVTAEEIFTPLVTSDSVEGWVQRGGTATYEIEKDSDDNFVVVGTAVVDTPNSFLCPAKEYGDFILEFDVKVDPRVNSGVQFRSQSFDKDTVYQWTAKDGSAKEKKIPAQLVHGYQIEIDPSDRAWSGGIYDEKRRGWLYNLDGDDKAEARAAFNPNGWNHYRLEAVGNSIKSYINGVAVTDMEDDVNASGFIGLQVHAIKDPTHAGAQIRWRNVKIHEVTNE